MSGNRPGAWGSAPAWGGTTPSVQPPSFKDLMKEQEHENTTERAQYPINKYVSTLYYLESLKCVSMTSISNVCMTFFGSVTDHSFCSILLSNENNEHESNLKLMFW